MKKIFTFSICILIPFIIAIIGSHYTMPAIPDWYATIEKPTFNPPSWIFGPVWTTLYFMMGVSLFLVWQNRQKNFYSKISLIIFGIHLLFNASWSIIFFSFHNIGLAFLNILVLWALILTLIILFRKINKTASNLLIPYFLWVSFASFLNYSIYILN